MERDRSCAIETVIAVILCAIICRVRNFCTDVPSGFVSAQTDKGQIFPLGVSGAGNTVKCVVALAELDGVSTVGFCHSLFNCRIREVFRTIIFVIAGRIDIDCLWLCCQRRDRKHAKQHDYTQQGGKNPFFHFVLLLFCCRKAPGRGFAAVWLAGGTPPVHLRFPIITQNFQNATVCEQDKDKK